MSLSIATVGSLTAALFAYLSWKKAVLIDVYEREELLRARLAESLFKFQGDHFDVEGFSVRVEPDDSLTARCKQYLPRGDVDGRTSVSIFFSGVDAQEMFRDDFERAYFASLDVQYITGKLLTIDEEDDGSSITLTMDSIDPITIESYLVELKSTLDSFVEHDGYESVEDDETE